MTTVRSLANLLCITCDEVTLHDYNVCRRCNTPNNSSAQAPIVKPYARFNTIVAKNFSPAFEEAGQARRRARAARHQIQRGVMSKC